MIGFEMELNGKSFAEAAAETSAICGRVERRPRGAVVASYDYADEHGNLLFQCLRYEPKAFSQRRPGLGTFDETRDLQAIEKAFEAEFDRPLPISADGETDVHRALGFDHRGRVDVAIDPRAPEGVWLRRYLRSRKIPYYAFTSAVAGKATAAHIHIGPGSTRLQRPASRV